MKKQKIKNKKFDLLVVFLLFFAGIFLAFLLNAKPLIGGLISLLPPIIYLSWREKKNWEKIFLAIFLFGIIFGFIFDIIETYNKAWEVKRLVFDFKFFNILPLDDVGGFVLMTLIIVIFYEHFIDDERNKKISKNLIYSLIPSLLISAIMILLFSFSKEHIFSVSYPYFWGGLAAIIIPIVLSIYKPKLLPKFLLIGAFFFIIWLIEEWVAIKTGGWVFNGNYIGSVTLLGVVFPFEELFFWMLLYSPTIVSYYELFVDDEK